MRRSGLQRSSTGNRELAEGIAAEAWPVLRCSSTVGAVGADVATAIWSSSSNVEQQSCTPGLALLNIWYEAPAGSLQQLNSSNRSNMLGKQLATVCRAAIAAAWVGDSGV